MKDVQFINDSWKYVKRTVNINNFTIDYTLEGGFQSQDYAEKKEELRKLLQVVSCWGTNR